MKKILLSCMALAGITTATNAQTINGSDWIKVGVHAVVPTGDASDVSSFVLGLDAKYQFLNYNSFGLGFSTGYTHYFGKDIDGVDDKINYGVVPLAALIRYYPTSNFFIGTDLGAGFLTGDIEDADVSFYYRPELGYHSDDWNAFVFYQGLSGDFEPSAVGVGLNYNIVQGK